MPLISSPNLSLVMSTTTYFAFSMLTSHLEFSVYGGVLKLYLYELLFLPILSISPFVPCPSLLSLPSLHSPVYGGKYSLFDSSCLLYIFCFIYSISTGDYTNQLPQSLLPFPTEGEFSLYIYILILLTDL